MVNPCLSCQHHLQGGDKGDPGCTACKKRLEYVASIGPMSHSMPDNLCDYDKTKPGGINMPSGDLKICANPRCIHSGKAIPITKFSKDGRTEDGYAKQCRSCNIRAINKTSPKIKSPKKTSKKDPEIEKLLDRAVPEIDSSRAENPKLIISIDFSGHKEVFDGLMEVAEESIRTVEQQALWMFIDAHKKGLAEIERREART